MSELKIHAVWDAGTRWFHWINVLCIIGLAGVGTVILNAGALGVTGAGKVSLKTLHTWIGYAFAANLLWRLVWAWCGNRYARWRAILPGGSGYPGALRAYLAALLGGRPEPYVGHNPAGRLAVAVLLLLLAVQALTGLVLAGTDLFMPPFGGWIAQWVAAPGVPPATLVPYAPEMYDKIAYESMRALRKPVVTTHYYNFFILITVIVLHVVGVVVTELREGGNLVSAMLTGRKIIAGRAVDEDRP